MAKKALHFISILRDSEKFEQDLKKIDKIISSNSNISSDTEIKMLWSLSPEKFDPEFDILHGALFNPTQKTSLPDSNRILSIEQVICNELEPLSSQKILSEKDLEAFNENKSSKEWQEGFKKLRHLDKEDAATYATERALREDESALSNILITSLAQKTSLDYGSSINYINLEGISDTQAENFLPEMEKNPGSITKESEHVKGIRLDFSRTKERDEIEQLIKGRGELLYYHHPQLENINRQRNLRYAALKAQAQKRKSFLYRIFSPVLDLLTGDKFKKNTTFKAYKKGKLVSALTAEDLINDVEKKMRRSDGFLEKLRKRFIIKKIEKKLIKELTEEIVKKDIPEGVNIFSYLPDILNQFKKVHTSEADYKKNSPSFP